MNTSASIKFEIENIVKSNKSYSAKRRELATRLGLRPFEINLVLPAEARSNTVVNPRFTFKFGIELEMLAQASAVRMAIENQGCDCSGMLGYHHTNGNSRFELKSDSSIHIDRNTTYGNQGVECVSGVMNGTDLKTIEKVVKSVAATGAQVNKSTGYHVHISTPNMTDEWFINVFVNYAYAEKVIDSFMSPSRRANENTYCESLIPHLDDMKRADNISTVQRIVRDRYHKVNPMAYNDHSTIEFRQHQGTLNATKVVNWVKFCAALIAWSKTHRLDHELTSIDEMSWLTKSLKDFYKARQAEFGNAAA